MKNLIYKDNAYSLEELEQDYKNFDESMNQHDDFKSYYSLAQSLETYDHSYSRAGDRLEALHELIFTAKFSLLNSYKKFYIDLFESNEDYEPHLLRRSHYLKNAIVWYNSCEDYILQIISFAYDLHGIDITSYKKYQKALEECKYGQIESKLENIDGENAEQLLSILNNYHSHPDVKYLRRKLANNLKHHGNLHFEGLVNYKLGSYMERNHNTGKELYNSNWTGFHIVDIDETIEKLKTVHNLLVSCIRNVLEFIDFKACLPTGEKKIVLGRICSVTKDKADYRKILC
ncbi:hypothetical protein COJ21_22465 [Priestia megaterium]|uniref:hypothetical protein n=1 Tax=Priestia megaterium TaxID=1404 RepID=UPI000BF87BE4|nr:hypothetical protein [Priestia megaterium]PFK69358.1 hypothetical protein COJ21_22465 [Priestia megaterium]